MKFKGFSEGFSNRPEAVKKLVFFCPRPFQAGLSRPALSGRLFLPLPWQVETEGLTFLEEVL
jgi:hypothetical protein